MPVDGVVQLPGRQADGQVVHVTQEPGAAPRPTASVNAAVASSTANPTTARYPGPRGRGR